MWSNDAVADDDPDDASPWSRDDWVPESGVSDSAIFGSSAHQHRGAGQARVGDDVREPPPEDFEEPDRGHGASRSFAGRKVVAGFIVVALLVGSAGALLRNGGEPSAAPSTTSEEIPVGDAPPTTTAVDTTPPTSARPALDPGSLRPDPTSLAQDPIPPVVVGEAPAWVDRTIVVPEALASMAPTEVVTLSQSGIVDVTELPSGRTRSIDVSGFGEDLQLAVDDGSIVVFTSTALLQIRDDEPVLETEVSDGIIFVQSWTGTDSFIVTTPSTGERVPEQDWVLRADGTIEMLDNLFVDETSFFSRVFSPFGDALFTAPGGVYAADADGETRRISTGTLLATGSRHWAIEECDETLRCAYSIIEWDTGTVTPGVLDVIDQFGFLDPSTQISPDGRSIAYRGDRDGSGRRQILDVATGNSVPAGRINQVVYPDAWAADSSGLFYADRYLHFVDRATGTVTVVEDLDPIRTVATRPVAP
jgi:hypothetical protein